MGAQATITLRAGLSRPLSITEVDNNFSSINTTLGNKLDESAFAAQYTAADVLSKLLTVDTNNAGINATTLQGNSSSSAATGNTIVLRDAFGNFSAATITASLSGNVTGTVTGNVTGNLTGNVTGNLNGNVTSSNVSITGGSITGITDLAIADGGTGASTAANARTNLGLGSISTQNSNSVTITGGSITGITDLAIADGGTGTSSIPVNSVILGNGTSPLSGNLVAPGAAGNVLTSNGTTWTSAANNKLTLVPVQSQNGGLEITFTGIPSWAVKITISYLDLGNTTTSTNLLLMRLGHGSTYQVTNYINTASALSTSGVGTTTQPGINAGSGFHLARNIQSGSRISGHAILTKLTGNYWIFSCSNADVVNNRFNLCAGYVLLDGTLNALQIASEANSVPIIGSVSIMYE